MTNIIIRWLYSISIGMILSLYTFIFGAFALLFQDDPTLLEKLPKIATLDPEEVEKIPRDLIKRNLIVRFIMFWIGYFVGALLWYFAFIVSVFFGFKTSTKIYTKIPKLFYPILLNEMVGLNNSKESWFPSTDSKSRKIKSKMPNPPLDPKSIQETLITCTACGTTSQNEDFCMECGVKFSIKKRREELERKNT